MRCYYMAENGEKYIVTFKKTTIAFKFESYCKKKGLTAKLKPVPTRLSKSCGYACHIEKDEIESIRKLCRDKNINYSEFYKIDKEGKPHKLFKEP